MVSAKFSLNSPLRLADIHIYRRRAHLIVTIHYGVLGTLNMASCFQVRCVASLLGVDIGTNREHSGGSKDSSQVNRRFLARGGRRCMCSNVKNYAGQIRWHRKTGCTGTGMHCRAAVASWREISGCHVPIEATSLYMYLLTSILLLKTSRSHHPRYYSQPSSSYHGYLSPQHLLQWE